ncbi:hypothetical protein GA0115239_103811 [Streptomyces sp. BpilaLS-43]|nr:hypothetical protein GA0115239_103811 [Streptomyces sp. BpilaLS-43]
MSVKPLAKFPRDLNQFTEACENTGDLGPGRGGASRQHAATAAGAAGIRAAA